MAKIFLMESKDGEILYRIEAEHESIAKAVIDQIGWGYLQDEIEECTGARITGAWQTFRGKKMQEARKSAV